MLAVKAMVLNGVREPLVPTELPRPVPGPDDVLLRVIACGVCRTDLHVVDGELTSPRLPLILGHQIVGVVEGAGVNVVGIRQGDRVGVPWVAWTCGTCEICRRGQENLCRNARFTGYTTNGGFAEYAVADHRFCFPIPPEFSSEQAAPLLCAGLIGYRSLRLAGDADALGLYGFGAAAHILCQVAAFQGRRVFAFSRPGDKRAQQLARDVGATWAGDSTAEPPQPLDAAIIFAAVGDLVPTALAAVRPGGTVVCGGIHMSDIPSFPYSLLWEERVLRSVANLTRADAEEFLPLAARIPVVTHVETFSLLEAMVALDRLRQGSIVGAAVLVNG
jgi:alcohol dehydrogenase, propanol-preferring